MKRVFSLSADNVPKMSRFTVPIVEGVTSYELQGDGTPISWAIVTHTNIITGGDAYVIKKGREVIGYNADPASAVDTVSIDFSADPFADTDYVVTTTLSNIVDTEPSIYATTIEDKTANGFSVLLSGVTDSNNYVLNWMAVYETNGDTPISGDGSGAVGEITITDGQLFVQLVGFITGQNILLDVIYR